MLLLGFFGCATVPPQPITIQHGQPGQGAQAAVGNRTPGQDVAGLVEILRSKNLISQDEADRILGGKVAPPAAGTALSNATESKAEEQKIQEMKEEERIQEITARVTAELMNSVSEQVKAQVKESLQEAAGPVAQKRAQPGPGVSNAPETKEEQPIGKTPAAVTAEIMNSVSEQVKAQVKEEVAKEVQENRAKELEQMKADVTEEVRKDVQAQVSNAVMTELPEQVKQSGLAAIVPDWVRRISLSGDIRLRYEKDLFGSGNAIFVQPSNPEQLMNTTNNQDLFKYRVRIMADAKVDDEVNLIVRLSSGNSTNPVSTNNTIGTYFNRGGVLFDLAYLQWQPWKYLTMDAGRMPNPWFSSDLLWSRDLNFEGLALMGTAPVSDKLSSFVTVGGFPLSQDYVVTSRSKWLTAVQLGLDKEDPKALGYKVGAAYYYFSNISGIPNNPLYPDATDWTAPLYQQKGNSLFDINAGNPAGSVVETALLSEFKELNFTGALDIGYWDPYHIVLLGDFVRNLGWSATEIASRTGITNATGQTFGYQVGVSVGNPVVVDPGQWRAFLYYKYLESDAVVDAFTDPDFHLGGTNAKGWILGTEVALRKNYWITLRWLTADQISGPPLAIDVLQVDLNARF